MGPCTCIVVVILMKWWALEGADSFIIEGFATQGRQRCKYPGHAEESEHAVRFAVAQFLSDVLVSKGGHSGRIEAK